MALLDRKLKQRIVGAAVLVALVVVFLPMLFNREDEQRRVRVEAPPMPQAPQMAMPQPEPVATPEPAPEPPQAEAPAVAASEAAPLAREAAPSRPAQVAEAPAAQTKAAPAGRLDGDGLPITWSVQLASLSSRPRAEELEKKLRGQSYTAYIRSVDGMHRVYVGPLLDRGEAERVGGLLGRQYKLSPIVVRFQPERR